MGADELVVYGSSAVNAIAHNIAYVQFIGARPYERSAKVMQFLALRELVWRVGPAIRRAPVKPLGLALVPATLRLANLLRELAMPV